MEGKKVFVQSEGDDLKYFEVIREQNISHIPSSPIDSIPNMAIYGWNGWNYAVGSSMLLFNSLKENLIIYCILDSDYHSEIEKNERLEEAKLKGIDLHIWRKKEIENYFIVPVAIERIIIKRSNGDFSPSITEIKNKFWKYQHF